MKMYNRNSISGVILMATMTLLCIQAPARQTLTEKGPNVLFIAIEDFNPEHLGCYGGQALTPNIDRLASEGMLFSNAYCDVAVCNPSRTALLTGLRPATSGVFGNSTDWREMALPKIGFTLPQHFKNNGYETAKIGKIFHINAGHPESWTKELPERIEGRRVLSAWHAEVVPTLNKIENDNSAGWFNQNLHWGPFDCEPGEFRDGHYATSIEHYLAETHDKPFFLAVGFHAPHVKFSAPAQFFEMYDLDEINLPENPPNDLLDVPSGIEKNAIHGIMDSLTWKDLRRAQFACISYVDWCIGKVLDAVEANNLEENTIIVIWTDHGFGLGEHFQWSKGGNKLFNEITRVGCIWKVPGLTPEGSVSTRVVETIDFFPTWYELCNIETPAHVQGESFAGILKNPSQPGKKAAFTWGTTNRVSVQTERFRLNLDRDLDPASFELYDHKYDPGEFINVACNPQYRETIALLVSEYNAHLEKFNLFAE